MTTSRQYRKRLLAHGFLFGPATVAPALCQHGGESA